MSASVERASEPTESDLLLPFERQNLHLHYKDFYKTKRNNLFATIQSFPNIWRCFELLDEIWMRAFSDIERLHDPNLILPSMLFINAHAQFRIAFELGLSGCIGEAWNVLRSGIEAVAHASKILREPHLATVWLEKNDGLTQRKEFQKAFGEKVKHSLYSSSKELRELYMFRSQLSEWGTHTTVNSLARRVVFEDGQADKRVLHNYLEADPYRLAGSLFSMLLAARSMEHALFRAFEGRLKLDPKLVERRNEFEGLKERTRVEIIERFKVKPPAIWRVV